MSQKRVQRAALIFHNNFVLPFQKEFILPNHYIRSLLSFNVHDKNEFEKSLPSFRMVALCQKTRVADQL